MISFFIINFSTLAEKKAGKMEKQYLITVLAVLFATVHAIVEVEDFFPFGISNGDEYLESGDDTSSLEQNLSVMFPFFGYNHSSLWVNVNGAISFNAPISTYTPRCAPVHHEYRMISPFWADVDTQAETPTPRSAITYRESTASADLQKAKDEIVNAFPDLSHFNPTWSYIVTWYNVTFFHDIPTRTIRNTFQATITTDGRHSFAIFYYNKIQWTTGRASNGHHEKGIGGTPAQIGFDAGDYHNRTMLDVSCKDSVINVSSLSNVGKPGVFVFRIDSAEIIKPQIASIIAVREFPEGIKCPPNSIQLRTNESVCYSFHPSLSQFVVAERECNSFGANLVSLKNKYTGVYIPQLANLLFKHLEVEEFWTNAHRLIDESTFTWTDGKDFQYKNWKNNESEEKETINDCVAVNLEKGFWFPENCFSRLPFVCEFYGKGKEVPPTALVLEEFPDLPKHISNAQNEMDTPFSIYSMNY
uniref:Uncharacterized protein n=1 Tax=Panagrolaimus superbus TaxID=310955 RepID=A0A914Z2C5_9BILA